MANPMDAIILGLGSLLSDAVDSRISKGKNLFPHEMLYIKKDIGYYRGEFEIIVKGIKCGAIPLTPERIFRLKVMAKNYCISRKAQVVYDENGRFVGNGGY